jgi:hypothetical protein
MINIQQVLSKDKSLIPMENYHKKTRESAKTKIIYTNFKYGLHLAIAAFRHS